MTKEKEITVKRWKFNVINERGFEESWTGSFDSKEKMAAWYNKYGVQWENEGRVLKMVEYYITEKVKK